MSASLSSHVEALLHSLFLVDELGKSFSFSMCCLDDVVVIAFLVCEDGEALIVNLVGEVESPPSFSCPWLREVLIGLGLELPIPGLGGFGIGCHACVSSCLGSSFFTALGLAILTNHDVRCIFGGFPPSKRSSLASLKSFLSANSSTFKVPLVLVRFSTSCLSWLDLSFEKFPSRDSASPVLDEAAVEDPGLGGASVEDPAAFS